MALIHRIVALESLDATLNAESALGNNLISIEPMAYNAGAAEESALFLITFNDAAPEPAEVLIIHDTFTALTLNTDLNGWTPDTVNTPGNNWVEVISGRNEGDGTGRVERGSSNGTAKIDTGITDNLVRVELEVESVTTKQNMLLAILASSTWHSSLSAGVHGLQINHLNASDTMQLETIIDGVASVVASTTVARTVDTVHKYRLEFDGTDVVVTFDDVEVAALRQDDFAVAEALDGNSFVGNSGNDIVFWDNFKTWDLP